MTPKLTAAEVESPRIPLRRDTIMANMQSRGNHPLLRGEQVFWNHVRKTDGCWLWTGQQNQKGYGVCAISKRRYFAHRVAYALHYGSADEEKMVCHRCDNPQCVNPAHLFEGTARDNNADMYAKGRQRIVVVAGERHGQHKLTWAAVEDIRRRHSAGEAVRSLARAFGVSRRAIDFVLAGKSWRSVVQNAKENQ